MTVCVQNRKIGSYRSIIGSGSARPHVFRSNPDAHSVIRLFQSGFIPVCKPCVVFDGGMYGDAARSVKTARRIIAEFRSVGLVTVCPEFPILLRLIKVKQADLQIFRSFAALSIYKINDSNYHNKNGRCRGK